MKFRKENIKYIYFAIYFLITFGSYFIEIYKQLPNVLTAIGLIFLLSLKFNVTKKNTFIFISLVVVYFLSSISLLEGFAPLKYAVLVPFLAIISKAELIKIFKYFELFFIFSTIPSLIILLLHIFGIENIISSYTIDLGRPFIVYPGTVLQPLEMNNFLGVTFYRISGIQGEPGGTGTISILLLLIKGLNLNDNRTKANLFIGLITFSLAFYVLFAVFIIGNLFIGNNIRKAIRNIILISIFGFFVINTPLYKYYIERRVDLIETESSVESQIRTEVSSSEFFDYFFSQNIVYSIMGRGGKANSMSDAYYGARGINYMAYLYNYGLLNSILVFSIIYYFLGNLRDERYKLLAFLIIIGSFYQRPYIFNNGYFFLFFIISHREEIQKVYSKTFKDKNAQYILD